MCCSMAASYPEPGSPDSGDAVSILLQVIGFLKSQREAGPKVGGNPGNPSNQDQFSSSATSHCIHIVATKEWLP